MGVLLLWYYSPTMEFKYKYIMKEGNIIKPISKNEAKILRENNYGYYVLHGNGSYHRYLVVECTKVLQFLEKYRKSIRIK